jgi:hypothetical protein
LNTFCTSCRTLCRVSYVSTHSFGGLSHPFGDPNCFCLQSSSRRLFYMYYPELHLLLQLSLTLQNRMPAKSQVFFHFQHFIYPNTFAVRIALLYFLNYLADNSQLDNPNIIPLKYKHTYK